MKFSDVVALVTISFCCSTLTNSQGWPVSTGGAIALIFGVLYGLFNGSDK